MTASGLPKLKHDRVRAVSQLSRPGCVASSGYVSAVLQASEDSARRMQTVLKDQKVHATTIEK